MWYNVAKPASGGSGLCKKAKAKQNITFRVDSGRAEWQERRSDLYIDMKFQDWELVLSRASVRQFDDRAHTLRVTGDLPEGWDWKLYVSVFSSKYFNSIPLASADGTLTAVLTHDDLAFGDTPYMLQLVGTHGDVTRHTNPVRLYVGESLSGDGIWPEVPASFTAAQRAAESAAAAAAASAAEAHATAAAIEAEIPTAVSQLTNDAGYVSGEEVSMLAEDVAGLVRRTEILMTLSGDVVSLDLSAYGGIAAFAHAFFMGKNALLLLPAQYFDPADNGALSFAVVGANTSTNPQLMYFSMASVYDGSVYSVTLRPVSENVLSGTLSIMSGGGASGGEAVLFDDRNDDVQAYLAASAGYTAANLSTVSVVSNYASASVQDQDCPKPFLGTYNLTPGVVNTVDAWRVTTLGEPPRMLKLDGGWNVRDCGGWSADGGKVKYGLLFRGSRLENASSDDLALLASVGVKLDLDIRNSANASGSTRIPGASYRNVSIDDAYAPMIQNEPTAAANACIAAMQSIVNDDPVYVHCASGADRTGCICALLEAVLGVTDRDIDRDYELTCFSDVESQLTGRVRNGGSWPGFWAALPTTQGSTKMNVVKFLRDNGATTALLNSFRQKMIDGTPGDVDIPTYTVTNHLTGCTTSNTWTSADAGAPYYAALTPNSGYVMTTLTVTMGGTDITSSAVSGNTVTISEVTGNIVITALAEEQTSYTNLVRQSQEVGSTAVYNGGLGYKNGHYLDSGDGHESENASDCMTGCIPYGDGTKTQTDVVYIKGYSGSVSASHTRLCARNSAKTKISVFTGFLNSNNLFDVETLGTGYYKLTPKVGTFTNVAYLQFSFNQADGSGIVITKNEPIA